MSGGIIESMTRWDGEPQVYIALMAVSVVCLWLSLHFVLQKRKWRGRWRRLIIVALPMLVSLLMLIDFIAYVVTTYLYLLDHPNLW